MDIEITASELGHRHASYELFNTRHEVRLTDVEYLILRKLNDIENLLKVITKEGIK